MCSWRQKVGFWQCNATKLPASMTRLLPVLSMRMSEKHPVDMAVMFEPCSFKPTRVHSSKIFARALKMFPVMSRHNFHNGRHADIKQTFWEHRLQSSVLPQIFGILGIFFTTGGVGSEQAPAPCQCAGILHSLP